MVCSTSAERNIYLLSQLELSLINRHEVPWWKVLQFRTNVHCGRCLFKGKYLWLWNWWCIDYPNEGKYGQTSCVHCFAGFITDGNSKLVGNARIRQLRVQRNSCQVAGSMQQLVPGCHAPYSWEVEDTGSYGPGWNCSTRNHTTSTPNPWKYQTPTELRAYPVWGDVAVYEGGGFAAELGPDLQNASR